MVFAIGIEDPIAMPVDCLQGRCPRSRGGSSMVDDCRPGRASQRRRSCGHLIR
jgi:hypothetical protein